MVEVSVIIPTFNRREVLRRALSSVISQQDVVFEILVIDDGSSDGTEAMIRENFPEVQYFAQKNQGPSAARNRGIEKARGEWIAFLDSDDEWKPGKLKAQLDYFKSHPECRVAQTEEVWIRNGVRVNAMKKHQKYSGMIFKECLPLCIVSPSAVTIRRDVFEDVGLFDESMLACEDYDLWLRIASQEPIGLLEQAYTIKYGGHEDQQSHKFEAMDRLRIESLTRLLQNKSLSQDYAHATRNELQKKFFIFKQGAKKRGKLKEIEEIEKLIDSIDARSLDFARDDTSSVISTEAKRSGEISEA